MDEYSNIVERQKRELEAMRLKHKKEIADLKVRHEQEKSRFKQKRYVMSLHEWVTFPRPDQETVLQKCNRYL